MDEEPAPRWDNDMAEQLLSHLDDEGLMMLPWFERERLLTGSEEEYRAFIADLRLRWMNLAGPLIADFWEAQHPPWFQSLSRVFREGLPPPPDEPGPR